MTTSTDRVAAPDAKTITTCVDAWRPLLGANDSGFLERVYTTAFDDYVTRLRAIGFDGLGHVVDAGCGFGQWSVALAGLNARVTGFDVDTGRLAFVRDLAGRLDLDNLALAQGPLEAPGLPDGCADAVFCYGVLYCTDWRRSLAALAALVKPGGRLYVNAPDIGWTIQKWMRAPNATADYDPRASAADDLRTTLDYDQRSKPPRPGDQILIPLETLAEACTALGFEIVGAGAEGTVVLPGRTPGTPFFAGTYFGMPGFQEVLAQRR